MKAHVVTAGEACEPTTVKGLSNEDWELLYDLGVSLTELSVVSEMSLNTAVFALQQIQLHLKDVEEKGPLAELFKRAENPPPIGDHRKRVETLEGAISRVRILVTTTLVSLGVLGDLETGEDGLPLPVELPQIEFADRETLARLTAERRSDQEPS